MNSELLEKFLSKRRSELAATMEHLVTPEKVTQKYRALVELIAKKSVNLQALEEKASYYSRFEISVILFALSEGNTDKIESIAQEHLSGYLLSQVLPDVVEIAQQDLADCKNLLDEFKMDHFKILKRLNLG